MAQQQKELLLMAHQQVLVQALAQVLVLALVAALAAVQGQALGQALVEEQECLEAGE